MLCSWLNKNLEKDLDNENVEEERRAQNPEDDEISLIDLLAVLLRYRWLIIITTVVAMIFAVVFSAIYTVLPPEKNLVPKLYSPKALIFISGKNSYGKLATKFVETNSFLDAVLDEFDLITCFEIGNRPRTESRKALQKLISVEFDDKSSVFSISFTDRDPEFAKRVVDFSVKLIENLFLNLGVDRNFEEELTNSYKEILNLQKKIQSLENSVSSDYASLLTSTATMTDASIISLELEAQKSVCIQLKTQYELLKIKMDSEKPVFQVIEGAEIEGAEIEGGKFKPSRGMFCIIITFAAFFVSVFLAFALNAVENIRKDPEAMEKLRSGMRGGSRK